jgi:hypothetical protein
MLKQQENIDADKTVFVRFFMTGWVEPCPAFPFAPIFYF